MKLSASHSGQKDQQDFSQELFLGQLQVACIFYLACLTETCSFHYGLHKLNVTLLKFPNDVYDDIPSSMYKGMDANGSSGVDELITNGFHLHL